MARRPKWSLPMLPLLLAVAPAGLARAGPPPAVIFDTDMGNDADDVVALAMLHALSTRAECRLAAVTVSKDHPLAAVFVDCIDTFYGRPDVPVGAVRGGATPDAGRYLRLASDRGPDGRPTYPHRLASGADAADAVTVLRTTLAAADDGSVVVVEVGFSTNLARLLDAPPDARSPLGGIDLVRRKVRLLSIMGGGFAAAAGGPVREYNIVNDLPAARRVVSSWPTPIVFSGFEVGAAVHYPARSILDDYRYVPHHPVAEAYRLYNPPPHERPMWDPTAVLYAVRPDRGYFDISPPGRVTITDDGQTRFAPRPDGTHRYLIVTPQQVGRAAEAIADLASQPPAAHKSTIASHPDD